MKYFLSLIVLILLGVSNAQALDETILGVGVPYVPSSENILSSDDFVASIIRSNIGYGLVRKDKEGNIELEIASSVDLSNQNRVYTFELKDNILFSNGDELSAKDVKNSFVFWMEKFKDKSKRLNDVVERVDVVVAGRTYYKKQKNKVRFVLKNPESDFLELLSNFPILHSELMSSFGSMSGYGTMYSLLGPYQVRSSKDKEVVELERSRDFYRTGYPRSGVVSFKVFEDAPSALSALRVGSVDIIALPSQELLDGIEQDDTLVSYDAPASILQSFKVPRAYWSDSSRQDDKFVTNKIIVRKSLKFDSRFFSNFDVSGTFLP